MRARTPVAISAAWRMILAATAAASLAPDSAQAASLHVGAVELPCPHAPELAATIPELVGPLDSPDCTLDLSRVASGYVAARLRCGDAGFGRTIPLTAHDCAEIPKTVAILVQGWVAHLRSAADPPASSPVEHRPVILPVATNASRPTAVEPRWRVSGAVGVNAVGLQAMAPAVAAEAEWPASRPTHLGLALGYAGHAGTVYAGREVDVAMAWSGVVAHVALLRTAVDQFDLVAGPSLHLLFARVQTQRQTLAEPSAVAAVRWTRGAGDRFDFSASLEGHVRMQRVRLRVGASPAFELAPLDLTLVVGAGFDAD